MEMVEEIKLYANQEQMMIFEYNPRKFIVGCNKEFPTQQQMNYVKNTTDQGQILVKKNTLLFKDSQTGMLLFQLTR